MKIRLKYGAKISLFVKSLLCIADWEEGTNAIFNALEQVSLISIRQGI